MLSLAASLVLGSALAGGQDQELAQFNQRLVRRVATVSSGLNRTGVAVLIGSSGLFLIHQTGLPKTPLITGTLAGRPLSFRIAAEDRDTGLILLQASPWMPSWGDPVKVSGRASLKGEKVFVMTVEGLRRSTVGESMRVGQVRPSLRYVPLVEMKLEEKNVDITGAVAFTPFGELTGVLSGAVGAESTGLIKSSLTRTGNDDSRPSYGPGGLELGFAYGPVLLDRVVAGFLSEDRRVKHPSIGVFFKQSSGGGAILELVMPKSPAEEAGLQSGDVIVEAGGSRISGPIDLAVLLFDQRIGSVLPLKVKRGSDNLDLQVRIGVQGGV